MRNHAGSLIVWALTTLFGLSVTTSALGQDTETFRDQVNRGTVGVISGGVNGTYIRVTSDLSAVLDSEDLRVLSILGKGSVQNIADLLYLRGIDVAVVQSDVLEFMRRQGTYPFIERHIQYITKLYNEEFHVLVRDEVGSIQDLAGKKVNFDSRGSGTAMTASLVFDTLGVDVESTHFDQASALDKLLSREISGLVYVAGQPVQLFEALGQDAPVKFLSIDYTPELMATYLPASLSPESYPNLINDGEAVSTIAVGAVMAAYNWDPQHHRYAKVARFVERFFSNFEQFQSTARHPKWREVSLSANVPGWTRFGPAQAWLGAHN